MANKYSPIWEQLKANGHVTLAVPVPLHKRVWRGLINCKDSDVAFKFMAAEAKKYYIMEHIAEHARIKIILREFIDTGTLTVADL